MSFFTLISGEARDSSGNILEGAEITVRDGFGSGGILADLFENPDGTGSISNPFTSTDGSFQFFVEPGKYRVEGTSSAGTGLRLYDVTSSEGFPDGVTIDGNVTGTAVTQSPTDTTSGRLIQVEHGYVRGSILGTVSQSSGTPTGAIIERGSNSNGEFVRFADGTQIVWSPELTITDIDSPTGNVFRAAETTGWVYAATFVDKPVICAFLDAANAWVSGSSGGTNLTGNFRPMRSAPTTVQSVAYAVSIGRWF